ncbi:N-formylglutamate deformylase [Saonia flava]|uniref:N-formylglutamate deformylase n=1 Tax=Saonia flava TaxID=523696 RepID=A0A846QVW3_9FLAO|nr:N-formylglutamate amidohydrolase [Saonia flava]NJB71070.1 N-formylglutamate deformylase [Saonia flava]
MEIFKIIEPKKAIVPIVISIPHSGTTIPKDIKINLKKRMRRYMDDTDWYVHNLYEFASSLGITVIRTKINRWVIDLNRDPESLLLYNDKRLITTIAPTTDFFGKKIYKSSNLEPDQTEINRRLANYYWPYYKELETLLQSRKREFGKVLLWDAHSIRHKVSTIQEEIFPDMILGNNDGATAHPKLINTALNVLKSGEFKINHNLPFKGGHITRYFGKPENDIHALQLEMNKILYMDDNEINYNTVRAKKVINVLEKTMESLIETIKTI